MATFVTHIVLGERIRKQHLPGVNRRQFIIGTSFPDIRYLASIGRRQTHFDRLQLADIKAQDGAFRAGLKVHSWVDLEREKLVRELGLYELLPRARSSVVGLKLAEDMALYDQVDDWGVVVTMFSEVLEEELEYGAPKDKVERWHEVMARYVSSPPDQQTMARLIDDIGVSSASEKVEIMRAVELASNDEFVRAYINKHLCERLTVPY